MVHVLVRSLTGQRRSASAGRRATQPQAPVLPEGASANTNQSFASGVRLEHSSQSHPGAADAKLAAPDASHTLTAGSSTVAAESASDPLLDLLGFSSAESRMPKKAVAARPAAAALPNPAGAASDQSAPSNAAVATAEGPQLTHVPVQQDVSLPRQLSSTVHSAGPTVPQSTPHQHPSVGAERRQPTPVLHALPDATLPALPSLPTAAAGLAPALPVVPPSGVALLEQQQQQQLAQACQQVATLQQDIKVRLHVPNDASLIWSAL